MGLIWSRDCQAMIPYPSHVFIHHTVKVLLEVSGWGHLDWRGGLQEAFKNCLQAAYFFRAPEYPEIRGKRGKSLPFNERSRRTLPCRQRTGCSAQQTWLQHLTLFNPKVKEEKQRDTRGCCLCMCTLLSPAPLGSLGVWFILLVLGAGERE